MSVGGICRFTIENMVTYDRRGSSEDLADEGGTEVTGREGKRALLGTACSDADSLGSSASGSGVTATATNQITKP